MSSRPALTLSKVNSYAVVDCISVSLLRLNSNALLFKISGAPFTFERLLPDLSTKFAEIEFSLGG